MRSNRASTSVEPRDRQAGVLDFGRLMAKNGRSMARHAIEDEDDEDTSSRSGSSNSSSIRRSRHRDVSSKKNKPATSGNILNWATTASRGCVSKQPPRSPIKSPKKSPRKSFEKGNSPLKGDVKPLEINSFESYQFNVNAPFLVKRVPEVGAPIICEPIVKTRKKKKDSSPIYPPGERTLLPLCVLQREPEPREDLDQLTHLLKDATDHIKVMTEAIRQKDEYDCIESVLARGLLATNNKPIFKKVLRWTMKNCREDMVKKIEKKLGLKLKKKTRAELENFEPESLPVLQKPSLKAMIKNDDDDDIDENLFPNLMVNRVLMRMNQQAEEKCRVPPMPKSLS